MPPGGVRRSQLITTYGVGAVVAFEDESFMVAGTDRWPVAQPNLQEPRLERELNVRGFVLPPAEDDGGDVPVVRFPMVHSCQSCRRLDRHSYFCGFDQNRCQECDQPLIPSRFVVACPRGHIDDFPYFQWVHAGHSRQETTHRLSIDTTGNTASLGAVKISCSCGRSRSMEGAFSKHALRGVASCNGRRPWLGGQNEPCEEHVRTLQRGASNVWFSVVRSALSIPPWSEGAFQALNQYWEMVRFIDDDETLRKVIQGMHLTEQTTFSVDDLVLAVKQRREREQTPEADAEGSLKEQEYEALIRGKADESRDQQFVVVPTEVPGRVVDYVEQIMLAKRLREVRALDSFTRILPPGPGTPAEHRAQLAAQRQDWLPGIEVQGEGVFLRLRLAAVEEWEARREVIRRIAPINERYAERSRKAGFEPDREITPRLVMIHTLAHALINQWSLEAGYPAAALRERLYVSDEMTGLLIYTATTDSAGSLGGVVAQAQDGALAPGLSEALARYSWCSSDPLCVEADAAGVDSLNLAACHACALLPETSCEEMNVLLDRATLVGTPETSTVGFFASLLQEE